MNQYVRCKVLLELVEQVIPLPKPSKSNFEVFHSIMSYHDRISQCQTTDTLRPPGTRQKLNLVHDVQISICFRLKNACLLSHPINEISVMYSVYLSLSVIAIL